jgi:hypothetical protein
MMALFALSPQKTVGQNPAAQVLFEFFNNEIWKSRASVANHLVFEASPVFLDQLIECGLFGLMPLVCEVLRSFFDHDVWMGAKPLQLGLLSLIEL